MSNRKKPTVGKTKITVIDKAEGQRAMFGYAWGLYFWQLPDGHLFKDDEGRPLNIPSVEGDIGQMAKIREAAAANGQPEGNPWFYAGIGRATDEEYEEQIQRMEQGLIPTMNDFGAVVAAKKTNQLYGGAE